MREIRVAGVADPARDIRGRHERACCEAQISSRSLGSPYVELRDGLAPSPTVGAGVVATTADEGWYWLHVRGGQYCGPSQLPVCSRPAVSGKHEQTSYEHCDRYHRECAWHTKHGECASPCQPEHYRAYEPDRPASTGGPAQQITHCRSRQSASRSHGPESFSTCVRPIPLSHGPVDPRRTSGRAKLGMHTSPPEARPTARPPQT